MSSDQKTDDELIAAIQGKDIDALQILYDRHRVLGYSLAMRMLHNASDAEDVLQEAFVNVWRASHTYRADRSGVRSWFLSIVHHKTIDKLRGRQSRIQPDALEDGMDVPADSDVWSEVANNLTGEDVRYALDQLPSEQRETIELAYFKGYSQSQIAQVMGVPLGTVKGRMRMALHKLKGLLQGSRTGLVTD